MGVLFMGVLLVNRAEMEGERVVIAAHEGQKLSLLFA